MNTKFNNNKVHCEQFILLYKHKKYIFPALWPKTQKIINNYHHHHQHSTYLLNTHPRLTTVYSHWYLITIDQTPLPSPPLFGQNSFIPNQPSRENGKREGISCQFSMCLDLYVRYGVFEILIGFVRWSWCWRVVTI